MKLRNYKMSLHSLLASLAVTKLRNYGKAINNLPQLSNSVILKLSNSAVISWSAGS